MLFPLLVPVRGVAAQVGSAVSLGPLGGTANAVLVDPTDSNVILAATFEDGLLRSTDGGTTFLPFGTGLSGTITHLQADPVSTSTYYAFVGGQIFRSTDGGANWAALSLNLPSTVRSLTIAGTVMLANDVGELWRSADSGTTWTMVSSGVVYENVIIANSNNSVVYLGHLGGVDKSTDGGVTFTPTAGFTTWSKALAVDPSDENVLWSGGIGGAFDKSIDGGLTSFPSANGWSSSSAQFIEFLPGSSTSLYGGALDGIYRSGDGGQNWQAVNQGLGNQVPIPNQLAFDANNNVYLATDGGFFTLSNQQLPWVQSGFATVSILDMTFGSPGGQRLAATTKGIYRANPGQPLLPSKFFFDFGGHTEEILVDPDDPTRWISGGVGSFIDNAQVRILGNDGQQVTIAYEEFGAGTVETLVMDPQDPDLMLGGVSPNQFGSEGIIRSTDRGQTWSGVSGTNSWPIIAIDIDPFDSQHAVAYFLDHAWAESTDAGASWTERTDLLWSGSGNPAAFAFDLFDSNVWYRVTTGEGLWRSDDAGQTWAALGTTANDASDLLLHPELEGHLWFSDGSGQVLYSTDRGASFELVFGLSSVDFGSLAFDESTTELLASSLGASAWEIDDATPLRALGGAAPTSTGDLPSHWTTGGLPRLGNTGFALAGGYEPSGAIGALAISTTDPNLPFLGGVLHVLSPFVDLLAVPGGVGFELTVGVPNDPNLIGQTFFTQYAVLDGGIVLSDAVAITILP